MNKRNILAVFLILSAFLLLGAGFVFYSPTYDGDHNAAVDATSSTPGYLHRFMATHTDIRNLVITLLDSDEYSRGTVILRWTPAYSAGVAEVACPEMNTDLKFDPPVRFVSGISVTVSGNAANTSRWKVFYSR